jgi:hypothetical protein
MDGGWLYLSNILRKYFWPENDPEDIDHLDDLDDMDKHGDQDTNPASTSTTQGLFQDVKSKQSPGPKKDRYIEIDVEKAANAQVDIINKSLNPKRKGGFRLGSVAKKVTNDCLISEKIEAGASRFHHFCRNEEQILRKG